MKMKASIEVLTVLTAICGAVISNGCSKAEPVEVGQAHAPFDSSADIDNSALKNFKAKASRGFKVIARGDNFIDVEYQSWDDITSEEARKARLRAIPEAEVMKVATKGVPKGGDVLIDASTAYSEAVVYDISGTFLTRKIERSGTMIGIALPEFKAGVVVQLIAPQTGDVAEFKIVRE